MKANVLVGLLADYRKIDCGVIAEKDGKTVEELLQEKFNKSEDNPWKVIYDPMGILSEPVHTGDRQYLWCYDETFEGMDADIIGIIYVWGGQHLFLYEIE